MVLDRAAADKERFHQAKAAAQKVDLGNKITADVRESFGKGAARKLRVLGKIPAVLYGHGTEARHLSLPAHETGLLLRKANAMLELDIAGEMQLALVRDVQKDPVRQIIEHIDLVVIRKGEKVEVEVPLLIIGEPAPGSALEQEAHTILVEVPAIAIPERIEVDVEGLTPVTHVYASDIVLADGVSLVADPETLIISVVEPTTQDLGSTEGEEAGTVAAVSEKAAE